MADRTPTALTIAGSDSSGCAGIQADIKTFSALGVFGMSAIAALTSQNTQGVSHIMPATVQSLETQLDAIFSDIGAGGVKTGMLFSAPLIEVTANRLAHYGIENLVVDPVMVATTGAVLLEPDAIEAMKTKLFPLAALITPNIPEAEVLANMKISSTTDVHEACKRLMRTGTRTVLIKGGHALGNSGKATDTWYDGKAFHEFTGVWTDTKNLHGTGCTFSAAIAASLALHHPLEEAIRRAKLYITGAIATGAKLAIGRGNGPVDHFWELRQ